MRNYIHSSAGNVFRRIASLAAGMAILSLIPMAARADDLVRVPWEGLSMTIGKTVLVATPGGPMVTGKVTSVEPDALVVQVTKTNDPSARLKGEVRVPRATLHVVRMQTKGVLYRTLGAFTGAGAGVMVGAAVALGIDWRGHNDSAAKSALIGIPVGLSVAGYLAGNNADRRWTTIEILP
jgi:hypothetical protein